MVKVSKLSKEDIVQSVVDDIKGRDDKSIESLQLFYYKILTEEKLRTSSFRYTYAKTAFETICNHINDTESIESFNDFHASKVKFEIANPVKKEEYYPEPVKKNSATREQRFGNAIKNSTAQFKV